MSYPEALRVCLCGLVCSVRETDLAVLCPRCGPVTSWGVRSAPRSGAAAGRLVFPVEIRQGLPNDGLPASGGASRGCRGAGKRHARRRRRARRQPR